MQPTILKLQWAQFVLQLTTIPRIFNLYPIFNSVFNRFKANFTQILSFSLLYPILVLSIHQSSIITLIYLHAVHLLITFFVLMIQNTPIANRCRLDIYVNVSSYNWYEFKVLDNKKKLVFPIFLPSNFHVPHSQKKHVLILKST